MPTVFLRLLNHDDKAAALAEAVDAVRDGQDRADVFEVETESFGQVPGSPFAYWVSERVRRLFIELPALEGQGRTVKQGLATADDFRFVRTWWEVVPSTILDGRSGPVSREGLSAFQAWCRERTFEGKRWVPFAKGGEYSPYYSDLKLVVNWERDGEEMKAWAAPLYGNSGWSRIIKSVDFYFRPGLTWPLRGARLSAQAVPAGSCFSVAGKMAMALRYDDNTSMLTIMNALPFDRLLRLSAGETRAQFEVGVIQRTPVPDLSGESGAKLGELARSCVDLKRSLDTSTETSHVFHLPALLQVPGATLAERFDAWHGRVAEADRRLAEHQREIDDIAFRLYGIDGEDRRMMEAGAGAGVSPAADEDESEDES